MYAANDTKLLALIGPNDTVLDIGGWACPFNRANFVMDSGPYDTRGYYAKVGLPGSQGGPREFFTRDTWIQRDICERTPFPFADKSLDWVTCSHTLEDIRDPLWVCSEMRRIARRGYIEVPSRLAESCRGWEHPKIAGLTHHRWLIDIENNHIRFFQKPHMIHTRRRFSLPKSVFEDLSEVSRVQWLFWDDSFTWEEVTIHERSEMIAHLESFVRRHHRYPAPLLAWDDAVERAGNLTSRVTSAIRRRLPGRRIR
jgi:hypothetical protein